MAWERHEETNAWPTSAAAVFSGMADWRVAHPQATLREIEAALDEHLAALRARMLEDLAQASAQTALPALAPEERPRCPDCGTPLEARGRKRRRLTTTHDRTITLDRSYAVCPVCGTGVFPPR